MKIEQEQKFKPIEITLETLAEAILFWELVENRRQDAPDTQKDMANSLSDWFSSKAHL